MWYWSFCTFSSWNVVVRFPSSFIRSLIGSTGNKWYVVYINAKWIYASETLACTIRECTTLRNVLHVTLTCLFISWCYGAGNVKLTPRVWHSSLDFVELKCVPASYEIILLSPIIQIRLFLQIWIGTYPTYPSLLLWKFLHTIMFWNILVGINN